MISDIQMAHSVTRLLKLPPPTVYGTGLVFCNLHAKNFNSSEICDNLSRLCLCSRVNCYNRVICQLKDIDFNVAVVSWCFCSVQVYYYWLLSRIAVRAYYFVIGQASSILEGLMRLFSSLIFVCSIVKLLLLGS